MPLLMLLAVLLVPFAEIALLVWVGTQIGAGWTLLAVLASTVAGSLVVRGAGRRAWRSLDEAMREGRAPDRDLADTAMAFLGGMLMIVPGFLTTVLGALVALPLTRPLLRGAFTAWMERRIRRLAEQNPGVVGYGYPGPGEGGEAPPPRTVIQGEVLRDDRRPAPGDPDAGR
ncbi:FxsA family protein [Allonocardiopsis opalescens]|uniref:UPF0716 protein FxsA n=1 Tax=Allonocardiopsis opalescens TaxID=1144618 RepID=A0A2T0PTU6_9ACTN|nr:FxsA family protein [Allonocardiopsis opalescens]PRX92322.1 UPF0716 protein FxsA [Allonocardiopsis opalescens]